MSGPGGLVRVQEEGGVATVVLDDPAHRNALSLDMVQAVTGAVEGAVAGGCRALVLANAPPVFCAGGSVDDLLHPRAPLQAMVAVFGVLAAVPVPTVAAVDGPALGAGMTLALACDVVLCTPRSRFDVRFLDIGLHPGGGQLWHLRQRLGAQGAAAMALFGEALDGHEAARRGLAWRCVDPAALRAEAGRLAARAAGRDPAVVARTKQTLAAGAAVGGHGEAAALELEPQRWSMAQPAFARSLAELRARLGRPS